MSLYEELLREATQETTGKRLAQAWDQRESVTPTKETRTVNSSLLMVQLQFRAKLESCGETPLYGLYKYVRPKMLLFF